MYTNVYLSIGTACTSGLQVAIPPSFIWDQTLTDTALAGKSKQIVFGGCIRNNSRT